MDQKNMTIVKLMLDEGIKEYIQELMEKQKEEIIQEIQRILCGQGNAQTQVMSVSEMERMPDKEEIKCLQSLLDEKEKEIQELGAKVEKKEQTIQELDANVAEKELKIQELGANVEEREQRIQELGENVSQKEYEITELKQKKADLNKELHAQALLIEESRNHIRQIYEENKSLIREKDLSIERLKEERSAYQERFGEAEAVYMLFSSLSQDSLERLSHIFEKHDFWSFMAAGLQWDAIEGLWNFIKRKIMRGDFEDIESLTTIFYFLFEAYNHRFKEAKYQLIEPVEGDDFDKEIHHMVGKGTEGKVKRVGLAGYRDQDGKVLNKALIQA